MSPFLFRYVILASLAVNPLPEAYGSASRGVERSDDPFAGPSVVKIGAAIERDMWSLCDPDVYEVRRGISPLTFAFKDSFTPCREKEIVPCTLDFSWDAIIAPWDVAEDVLRPLGLGRIRFLELEGVPADADLSFLADAVRLECLLVRFAHRHNVTLDLPRLPKLSYVSLAEVGSLADITALERQPNLKGIGYDGYLADGLSLFRDAKILPRLDRLDILFAKWLASEENLGRLVHAYLDESSGVIYLALPWGIAHRDLQYLAERRRFDALRYLRLYGDHDISDLRPLRRSKFLQGIDLAHSEELRSLDGLLPNESLRFVSLPWTSDIGLLRSAHGREALLRMEGLRLGALDSQGLDILQQSQRLRFLEVQREVDRSTLCALHSLPAFRRKEE